MRGHGNWCGPNWTAGQNKPAKDLTEQDRNVPAIDALDEACKAHDIQLHDDPEHANEINKIFIDTVSQMGIKGKLFALAVGLAGPSPQINLPASEQMGKKKLRLRVADTDEGPQAIVYSGDEDPHTPVRKQSQAIVPRRPSRNQGTRTNAFMDAFGQFAPDTPEFHASQSNLRPFPQIENTMDDVDMLRTTGDGGTINNQETPVTQAQPSYGVQETHTTILPVTFYGSMVLENNVATDLILRLNDPYNPLVSLLSAKPANVDLDVSGGTQTFGARYTQGLYNSKIKSWSAGRTNGLAAGDNTILRDTLSTFYAQGEGPNGTRWTVSQAVFPDQLTANTQPIPLMADWYKVMYDWYHCLGCEYEIVMQQTTRNAGQILNNDVIIFETMDIHSNGNDGNKVDNNARYSDALYWKRMKKHKLQSSLNDNFGTGQKVFKGYYSTGSAKGLIENDGDVKRWIKPDVANTFYEDLHLLVFPDPFNTLHNQNVLDYASTTALEQAPLKTTLNFKVTLKYTVQFKDLLKLYRNPTVSQPQPPALDLMYIDYSKHENQTRQ